MLNVMEEYISYVEKSFLKYMKLIYESKYDKSLALIYIQNYISVRYSNYIDESTKRLPLQKKINKVLDDVKQELLSKDVDGKKDLIENYRLVAGYFYNLDQLYLLESQKKTIEKIDDIRKKFLNIEKSNFTSEFNSLLREDIRKRKEYLVSFESKIFNLEYKKINKNEFGVSLSNKISFPEIYSDIAIKKAAEKESINEDMSAIAYLQLASVVTTNLVNCDFDKIYYIYLPNTFFDKKVKVNRIFNIFDSTFIQDKVRLVIDFKCFTRYKVYIMEFMRKGFVFGIYLDETFDYNSDNTEFLDLFEKIFLDSEKYYFKDMKNNVKIDNRIVNIDEVK